MDAETSFSGPLSQTGPAAARMPLQANPLYSLSMPSVFVVNVGWRAYSSGLYRFVPQPSANTAERCEIAFFWR
jgi:hypothetical protein